MKDSYKPVTLPRGKQWAALLGVAMTVVVLILRVVLTPLMQDVDTGLFHPSYIVIAVMVLTGVAVAVLLRLSPSGTAAVQGGWVLPTALFAILSGAVMTLTTLWDASQWLLYQVAPPPSTYVVGAIDALVLTGTLLFGITGGAVLVWMGMQWLSEGRSRRGRLKLLMLLPVGWVWMRLARYQVSYASAVSVSSGFYDFVMLAVMLLFLFALARYVSGVGEQRSRWLIWLAIMAGLCSSSGAVTQVFLYMQGQGDAYAASRLAGATDGLLGVFALLFGLAQAFAPANTDATPAEQAESDSEPEADPTDSPFV